MILVLSTCFLSGCSVGVPGAKSIRPKQVIATPQTSDQVMAEISDLINHGNLSDRMFYARTLGVSFAEGVIINAPLSFNICGFTTPPEQVVETRRYVFQSMPWFVDSSKTGKLPCFADLIERLDDGKVLSAGIQLNIDSDRVCIKQEDIRRRFPSVKVSVVGVGWTVLVNRMSDENISIDFLFLSSKKMCISRININQIFKGVGK
ncbi:hypothetical protein [Burkholderia plantarii]|uniref:hypothetical protein n=1 Tax=Burkholderia plantarii TaxID=41899 RepID=UPI0018DCE612|nr:hypothetical protein [Burkholderia plantarii]MBI0330287.1 hypothetical protein [Burkholderia plantarii]